MTKTILADPFAHIAPLRRGARLTVVIPARNEALHIERTLAALTAQRALDGGMLDPDVFDVLVYANNCDDDTVGIARRFAECHPAYAIAIAEEWLPSNVAHIGTARRAAMNVASQRLVAGGVDGGVIAATDADTIVSPTWIAWTLREMDYADVVTGRVLVDPVDWGSLPGAVRTMLVEENAYQFACAQLASALAPKAWDPWPRHWQRSGPSFAVRVDAYERVGGVPPVRALEDVALYDALHASGARIRHSLRVRVWTSARFCARAPGGFGERIRLWNELNLTASVPLLVEDPAVTLDRILRTGAETTANAIACVPVAEAIRTLRQLAARGSSVACATRSTTASIAG